MRTGTEELINAIAVRQCGLVTRAQLLRAGLTPDSVKRRVRMKRLRPIHRGVYQVGPLTAPNAREMAAVLGCGPGAVISHRSAATLWQLLPRPDDSAPVYVTIPGRHRVRRPGIRTCRVSRLESEHVSSLDGIPVTSPARTVLDLAGMVGRRQLEQAIAQAERRELMGPAELLRLIARHPKRRGMRMLRALLVHDTRPVLTRSKAEERFLALIRRGQLPSPEANVVIGGYEVDFLWRSDGIAVEVDGFAFHSSRRKFESDRRRDAELSARGIRVVRVTWQQVCEEPEAMLVRLAQTLARPSFS